MASDLPINVQKEIIERFPADPEVFEQVYNCYFEPIIKYLSKRTMSAEIAYDLTADTFLKAFNTFHKFKWTGVSMKVWIYRIATNALKDQYRKSSKNTVNIDDIEGHEAITTDAKAEMEALNQAMFGDDELKVLATAMKTLNPKYQQVLSLFYFSGLSQAEIGEVLGKSSNAVKAMVHRAIEQLRAQMNVSNEPV